MFTPFRLKLKIKIRRFSGVFIVNFERISHFFLVLAGVIFSISIALGIRNLVSESLFSSTKFLPSLKQW